MKADRLKERSHFKLQNTFKNYREIKREVDFEDILEDDSDENSIILSDRENY